MNSIQIRKALIEAYIAGGAAIIDTDSKEYLNKQDGIEWYNNEFGLLDVTEQEEI